ncbi:unnamed protein product [Closterium sp. NIES-65]|nr:unnamed protein product [Closterium sp. NIES-65]
MLLTQPKRPRWSQFTGYVCGLFYCGFLPSFWVTLRCGLATTATTSSPVARVWPALLGGPVLWTTGLVAIFMGFAGVIAADTGAYLGGKTFGKTPLSELSPKKTVEGALFGLASSVSVSVLLSRAFSWPATPISAAVLGVIVFASSLFGDLFESALKRQAGVKDAGSLIPGHAANQGSPRHEIEISDSETQPLTGPRTAGDASDRPCDSRDRPPLSQARREVRRHDYVPAHINRDSGAARLGGRSGERFGEKFGEEGGLLETLGQEIVAIVTPVSICMLLVVALVLALTPHGASVTTPTIATLVYQEESTDAPWQRLWGALLNAAAMVALVTAATFVLVGLFYCGCARCIWGYMGFSGFVIFAGLGGTLAVQLIQVRLHRAVLVVLCSWGCAGGAMLMGLCWWCYAHGAVLVGLFYCGCARCIWGYMGFSGFVIFAGLGGTLAVQLIQHSACGATWAWAGGAVLVGLFYCGCARCIWGYMGSSGFVIFAGLGGTLAVQLIQRFSIPIDIITFALLVYNLSVVGVLAVFFCRMPIFLTQSYLVAVGAIVAFWFSSLPEWTTWMVLIAMSLYDLYAVLTPGNPNFSTFWFSSLPERTTWMILIAMSLYDLYAVLTPGMWHSSYTSQNVPVGPLKLLLDIAMERDEDIPALPQFTVSIHLLPSPPLSYPMGPLKLLLDIAMERDEDIPALIYEARPPPMPFAPPPPIRPPPRLLTPTRPLPSSHSLPSGPTLPLPPLSHPTMPTRLGHPPLSSSPSSSSSSFPPSLSPSTASNPSPSGTTFRATNSTAGTSSALVPNTALGQADGGGGSGGDGMTGGAVGSGACGSRRTRVRGQFERRLQQQGSGAIGAASGGGSGGGGGRTFAGQLSAFVASAAAAAATSALRLTAAQGGDERLGGERGEGRRGRGVEGGGEREEGEIEGMPLLSRGVAIPPDGAGGGRSGGERGGEGQQRRSGEWSEHAADLNRGGSGVLLNEVPYNGAVDQSSGSRSRPGSSRGRRGGESGRAGSSRVGRVGRTLSMPSPKQSGLVEGGGRGRGGGVGGSGEEEAVAPVVRVSLAHGERVEAEQMGFHTLLLRVAVARIACLGLVGGGAEGIVRGVGGGQLTCPRFVWRI